MIIFSKAKTPSGAAASQAQLEAGNYRKKHIRFQGLDISIENPKGSVRSGKDRDGHEWRTKMVCDYGYIKGTMGVDKDHVDCYIGPDKESDTAYVVHQRQAGNWTEFDEDKVMLAFSSEDAAKKAYLKHYDDKRFLGPVTAMPMDEFKEKALATLKKPKMIKALFYKAYVRAHTRKLQNGQVVQVGSYHTSVHANPKTSSKRDYRTLDMFSDMQEPQPGVSNEAKSEAETTPEEEKGGKEGDSSHNAVHAEQVERNTAVLESDLSGDSGQPRMQDNQLIEHDGDTWKVLSTGAERDGKIYAHLASTTRISKQRNGDNPVQIGDWIDADLLSGHIQSERVRVLNEQIARNEKSLESGRTIRGGSARDLSEKEAAILERKIAQAKSEIAEISTKKKDSPALRQGIQRTIEQNRDRYQLHKPDHLKQWESGYRDGFNDQLVSRRLPMEERKQQGKYPYEFAYEAGQAGAR